MKTGLINIYPHFSNFGGAQMVSISLHNKLKFGGRNFLMGFTQYDNINAKFPILDREQYLTISISNVIKHKNFVFISHHRKITTYLFLISRLLFLKLKIIHVAHNEFHSLKIVSLFPKTNIAVSNKVRDNLSSYFGIDCKSIKVIYNGIEDKPFNQEKESYNPNRIRILYPARINHIKQQLEIVKSLKDNLHKDISIHFAGIGEDQEELSKLCENLIQFNYLGFRDINNIIQEYDFVMLFSKNEGLPLSLIESCMYQKPILTNDVGGNLEILENNVNGFKLTEFDNLSEELNNLKEISPKEYGIISENVRKTFLSKFTEEKMISRYHEVLNKIE